MPDPHEDLNKTWDELVDERGREWWQTSVKTTPWQDRFWAKVEKSPGCWLWTGATTRGYGSFSHPREKRHYAHRLSYELLVGPIPHGLVIDHLCRVRNCVNPDHLEPVTFAENLRRGIGFPGTRSRQTHCIYGHEFTEANTYRRPDRPNTRTCRECRRVASVVVEIRRKAQRKAKAT